MNWAVDRDNLRIGGDSHPVLGLVAANVRTAQNGAGVGFLLPLGTAYTFSGTLPALFARTERPDYHPAPPVEAALQVPCYPAPSCK